MGSFLAKPVQGVMEKNQETMANMQQKTMERQIQMQSYMMERQMAMQMARGRDMFHWWASFYGVALLGMIGGFKKTRRPAVLAPLIPLTFIVAFQADLAYGNKMTRIKIDAEQLLKEDSTLFSLPGGLPSIEVLDQRRKTFLDSQPKSS